MFKLHTTSVYSSQATRIRSRQPGLDDGKFSDKHAWQQVSPNIENRLDFVVKRHLLISQKTPPKCLACELGTYLLSLSEGF